MFSIEHTITTLSALSRITSSSNSPQPITDSSSSTWPIGETSMPRATMRSNSSGLRAIPPPRPPSVKAGRTTHGRPRSASASLAWSSVVAITLLGMRKPGRGHRRAELLAVLGAGDGLVVGPDQLHAEALQRAVVVERLCQVERRLAAQRSQQRVRALALDHLCHRTGQERLDVGGVGELRVGHDRGRVGVDEHDLIGLLAKHLAGLHARVVELGRLADHDRAGAQDEDLLDVPTTRQCAPGSGRTDTGCRAVRGPPRGGTGRCPPARPASSSPSTVRS